MSNRDNTKGKVILAAAGPGDPELITLKTLRYLGKADVVIIDRLVSADIIKHYINTEAIVIKVGKQAGKESSTPQSTINNLLVEYALLGKLVVRLKGGDVSFFSNIMDELLVLNEHHISYEIIPGVTSASGAAAYAGIPLTARGYSTGVRFLTSYRSDIINELQWKQLSQTDDTLVFYMSMDTLDGVVEKFLENNISNDKLLAVIEQATTPLQHVHISGFYEYDEKLRGKKFISPSLVIVGKVVALHEQFKWISNDNIRQYYFKPLHEAVETFNQPVSN
jgi:uroporphyrin-III C-methyltransferase